MMLSPHFSLSEATDSQVAARRGINNDPPAELYKALRRTAEGLEQIRALLGGYPLIVSSWFRCQRLNWAIGGAPTSQHLTGEAADFSVPHFGPAAKVFDAVVGSQVPYDQLILEYGQWVHVSFVPHPRRQALIKNASGYSIAAMGGA